MVKNIFREALEQNVHADELAVHVFRWLRSPTSLLYDPALHRKLIGIMRKMLLKLVTDCKTYGCEIVHATGNWMVLSTNKGNVHEAVAQVRYTVDKVREADLFRALLITPKRAWTILLWLDAVCRSKLLCLVWSSAEVIKICVLNGLQWNFKMSVSTLKFSTHLELSFCASQLFGLWYLNILGNFDVFVPGLLLASYLTTFRILAVSHFISLVKFFSAAEKVEVFCVDFCGVILFLFEKFLLRTCSVFRTAKLDQ